ncbi:hypothetical protein CGRA01v4_05915 [Colletotrichum graminicola]|nr:hypothetical protein CGRA01v4_05915 [Colletotrichum graminicola]
MGTCVPQSLLGFTGYFCLKQQNIESIRLVTDGACGLNDDVTSYSYKLQAFPHLKRLSWTGLLLYTDFMSLAEVLEQRSHQLEELEIDMTYYSQVVGNRELVSEGQQKDPVGYDITLTYDKYNTIVSFPLLKRLALSAISFTSVGRHMCKERLMRFYTVFDSSLLQSLKLQHCQGWEQLIRLFNERAEPLKLRSLELQWSSRGYSDALYETLSIFLQRFQGLEELFLFTPVPRYSVKIWRAVLHHRASLRRFVHHQRVRL